MVRVVLRYVMVTLKKTYGSRRFCQGIADPLVWFTSCLGTSLHSNQNDEKRTAMQNYISISWNGKDTWTSFFISLLANVDGFRKHVSKHKPDNNVLLYIITQPSVPSPDAKTHASAWLNKARKRTLIHWSSVQMQTIIRIAFSCLDVMGRHQRRVRSVGRWWDGDYGVLGVGDLEHFYAVRFEFFIIISWQCFGEFKELSSDMKLNWQPV